MKYFAYSQKEFLYKYIVMLSDIDQFRHMSFANYLRLMFLASDAFLMPNMDLSFTNQYCLKLKDSRMQFKRQTMAGDSILIKLNASHVSDLDFSLFYTFVTEHAGDLIALGRQTFELRSSCNNNFARLPDAMKQQLKMIEIEEEHLLYKY